MRPGLFILALLLATPVIAEPIEVPPSEPLRLQSGGADYRWRAASSSQFDEPARRYDYGQQSYNYAIYGGWYRPTFYFGSSLYTYRGISVNSSRGYAARSIQRFHGPVPLRWTRRR